MAILSKVKILTLSQQFSLIFYDTVKPWIKSIEKSHGVSIRSSRHFWTGVMKNFWDLARSDIVSSSKDIKRGVIRRRRAQRRRLRQRDRTLAGTSLAMETKPIPAPRKGFSFDQVGGWGDLLIDRFVYYPSTVRQAFPLVDRILTEAEEVQSTSVIRSVSPSGSIPDRPTYTTRTVSDTTIRELGAALSDVVKWRAESPLTYLAFLMAEDIPVEEAHPRLCLTLGLNFELNRPLVLTLRYIIDHKDVYDLSPMWDISFLSLRPSVRAIAGAIESIRLVLKVAWRVLNVFTLGIPALINYLASKIQSLYVPLWNNALVELGDRTQAPFEWVQEKLLTIFLRWYVKDPLSSLYDPEETRQEARELERSIETRDFGSQAGEPFLAEALLGRDPTFSRGQYGRDIDPEDGTVERDLFTRNPAPTRTVTEHDEDDPNCQCDFCTF